MPELYQEYFQKYIKLGFYPSYRMILRVVRLEYMAERIVEFYFGPPGEEGTDSSDSLFSPNWTDGQRAL